MHDSFPKGFIIGGTHSGCGKTTVTMGLIRALRNRGFDVRTWKSGPDYIDPAFHAIASGSPCRNLDTMMLSDDAVREIYCRGKGGFSIIEGVMGLFDSAGPRDERGSAAHLAKLLGLPVILVIDGRAMARSAAAIALGFSLFDPDVNIAGIIMNRVGSERHFEILRSSIEDKTGIPVLGYLPAEEGFRIPERHLGLVQDLDGEEVSGLIESLAGAMGKKIDLDKIIDIASSASDIIECGNNLFSPSSRREPYIKMAVARDRAFCFYYEDNLDLLRHRGVEIHFFSPLEDRALPDDISAIYLGGGYPELYAAQLSENSTLREQIASLCRNGMPVFGECGGFMYLTEGITDSDNCFHPMIGILPGRARLGRKLRSLGYCRTKQNRETILGDRGTEAMGHIFHWADLEMVEDGPERAFSVRKGDSELEEGFVFNNVLASWVHLHFASNIKMVDSFIEAAVKYRKNHG